MTGLLIADDLTGACDAAVHFAMRGLRPATVLVERGEGDRSARLVAITTESRDLEPAGVRRALCQAAAAFPADSADFVFKKIDSTLRGNTGLEIATALDAFGCDAAVVCPAFPAMHRVVEAGTLRVTNASEFAPIDVAGLLGSVHTAVEGIRDALSKGVRIVSVDANCDRDLERIAAVVLPMGRRVLWAGSAGLASALACLLGEAGNPLAAPARAGAALFCIGSDHAVTLAQQSALLAGRPSVLFQPHAATREAIAESLARGRHVVLRIQRGEAPLNLAEVPAAALVLSGGDTASLVCRSAGVRRIELGDEIVPGVPLGILRGGDFEGSWVATKSGGFGNRDTLVQVADYFSCPHLPLS